MRKPILLLQPKVGVWDSLKTSYSVPLSLLQAVTIPASEGYPIILFDQRLNPGWETRLDRILSEGVLWAGTTCMAGPQITHAFDMLRFIKLHYPDIPTILGGKHASLLPDLALKSPFVDAVIKGDAEYTVKSITTSLLNTGTLTKDLPPQVSYTLYHNKPCFTSTPVDYNTTPPTPYHLVNLNHYQPCWNNTPYLDVFTSQGCPNACTFCYNPAIYGRGVWRSIPSHRVITLIDYLHELGVTGIWFVDDEFFGDLDRSESIIKHLKSLGIRYQVQGTSLNTVSRMSDAFLSLLENTGLTQLNMGVESASPNILRLICKNTTSDLALRVNQRLKPYNLTPWYYFMVGFPGETLAEIKSTVDLALKLLKENPRARVSPFACFTPYPGTPLYLLAQRYGFAPPDEFEDWATFATDNINTPWITKDLYRLIHMLQVTSLFIDRKPEDRLSSLTLRLFSKLYRPISRYRFSHLNPTLFGLEDFLFTRYRNNA